MKNLLVLVSVFLISACATPRDKAVKQIKPGMTKEQVLELAGNPSRSSRISGADRWSYDLWHGEIRQTYNVHFVNGQVTNVAVEQGDSGPKDKFKAIGR
jgi:outer membrane protein assembly factor BamE (lipoprotein component of BamABCDE complex)